MLLEAEFVQPIMVFSLTDFTNNSGSRVMSVAHGWHMLIQYLVSMSPKQIGHDLLVQSLVFVTVDLGQSRRIETYPTACARTFTWMDLHCHSGSDDMEFMSFNEALVRKERDR